MCTSHGMCICIFVDILRDHCNSAALTTQAKMKWMHFNLQCSCARWCITRSAVASQRAICHVEVTAPTMRNSLHWDVRCEWEPICESRLVGTHDAPRLCTSHLGRAVSAVLWKTSGNNKTWVQTYTQYTGESKAYKTASATSPDSKAHAWGTRNMHKRHSTK